MSGGFFRGTSAEQDTRFSNKQAKLMKSQKFAPELETLVDVSKVQMDVMKPWIATRVTELLGFEDEVLINFIYGLLDKKVVNGKEIQIAITGFMEKNTAKFMKELWILLLSAQNNASGVPQQFLDAKEAERKKKEGEAIERAELLANEIGKRREIESKRLEHDMSRKIDNGGEPKGTNGMETKRSGDHPEDGRRAEEKNGVKERRRDLISPRRRNTSRSPLRGSRSRSISKTNSGSRSNSDKRKSRSLSRSSDASVSPRKRRYSRRRSRSRSLRRSLSPRRRRIHSPNGSRSRSPVRRHRSPTPLRRRRQSSPPSRRRRSPSPYRRRRSPSPPARRRRSPSSPVRRRRSPSPPVRRRRSPSPPRRSRRSPSPPARLRRSPLPSRRRRSPSPPARRRRSPSPLYKRNRSQSPLVKRGRSDSPGRSAEERLPSPPAVERLPSPPPRRPGLPSPTRIGGSRIANHHDSPSPSSLSPHGRRKGLPSPPVRRRSSLSPVKEQGSLSPAGRLEGEAQSPLHVKQKGSISPVRGRGRSSPSPRHHKGRSPARLRSPLPVNRRSRRSSSASRSPDDNLRRRSPSWSRSLSRSPSPPVRRRSPSPGGRKQRRDRRSPGHPSEERDREDRDTNSKLLKKTSVQSPDSDKRKQLPEKAQEVRVEYVKERERQSEKLSERHSGHRILGSQMSPASHKDSVRGKNPDVKRQPHSNKVIDSEQIEKEDNSDLNANHSSDSKESNRHRTKDRKRKHKRSDQEELSSDDNGSSGSDLEDRKEAKRRRKEEKKARKEEKKRRREERRRKREERRGEKLKVKKREHSDSSEGEADTHPRNRNGEESDPRKLEIELRNKALESLKAKKGISH